MNCGEIEARVRDFSLILSCEEVSAGLARLATPFLYPDGSNIDIFVRSETDLIEPITLTDLGQTAEYLSNLLILPYKNQKRRKLLSHIASTLGVSEVNGELLVKVKAGEDFGRALSCLAQACVRISDLSFLQRFRVESNFKEDVEDYISSAPVQYEADVWIPGKYEIVPVDFRVEGVRSKNLVCTLAPSLSASHQASNEVFRKWWDLADRRDEYGFLTVVAADSAFRADDLKRLEDFSTVLTYPTDEGLIRDMLVA